jgi:hypothetical protein
MTSVSGCLCEGALQLAESTHTVIVSWVMFIYDLFNGTWRDEVNHEYQTQYSQPVGQRFEFRTS